MLFGSTIKTHISTSEGYELVEENYSKFRQVNTVWHISNFKRDKKFNLVTVNWSKEAQQ